MTRRDSYYGTNQSHNHPFDEVCAQAGELIKRGMVVYQKFTCGKCKTRQTIDVPNTFYTQGSCEECHHITDIRKTGCNYLLSMGGHNITEAERRAEMERNALETEARGVHSTSKPKL